MQFGDALDAAFCRFLAERMRAAAELVPDDLRQKLIARAAEYEVQAEQAEKRSASGDR